MDMHDNILLNGKRGKNLINVDNSISLELKGKYKQLPEESVNTDVDIYRIYNDERNNCKKYRLMFSISPYCSNVLFNPITEVIYREGSDECFSLENKSVDRNDTIFNVKPANTTETITKRQAMKDSEITCEKIGGFEYKCGIDIFSNHYLRSNGFFRIGKANYNDYKIQRDEFNTLSEFIKDSDGNINKLIRETPKRNNDPKSYVERNSHMFNKGNVYSFFEAISNNLKEDNGWLGFYNKPYANIPNYTYYDDVVTINKLMNNRKPCEFVDMYPDRSLFSFNPKINKYRGYREEYNWKWFITYPFRKYDRDVDFFDKEMGLKVVFNLCKNGIAKRSTDRYVYFRTKMKHNLKQNDTIKMSYRYDNGEYRSMPLMVYSLGNRNGKGEDYYFSVSYDDLASELIENVNADEYSINCPKDIFVKKVIDGMECDYYIRVFRKLDSEYGKPIKSELNRAAFSETVFGDGVSELMFTDDISTINSDGSEIVDHMGYPVKDLFLTIVKNNKGYDKWYADYPSYNSPDVEFSHCFGPITGGFNMEMINGEENNIDLVKSLKNYNSRFIHNCKMNGETEVPEFFDVNSDSDEFIGDFVEYDKSSAEEHIIDTVRYRFNTVQREYDKNNGMYDNIIYDEIEYDDFDFYSTSDNGFSEASEENIPDFTVKEYKINPSGRGNIFPEGYFYIPHYKIALMENSPFVRQDNDLIVRFDKEVSNIGNKDVTLKLSSPVYVSKSDSIRIWSDGKYEDLGIIDILDDGYTMKIEKWSYSDNGKWPKIFIKNAKIPTFAQYISDGSGIYIWRERLLNSQLKPGDDTFGRVFSNGAIYCNDRINFYLRRQDPNGIYGLHNVDNEESNMKSLILGGEKRKDIDVEYKIIYNKGICEN